MGLTDTFGLRCSLSFGTQTFTVVQIGRLSKSWKETFRFASHLHYREMPFDSEICNTCPFPPPYRISFVTILVHGFDPFSTQMVDVVLDPYRSVIGQDH